MSVVRVGHFYSDESEMTTFKEEPTCLLYFLCAAVDAHVSDWIGRGDVWVPV